MTKQLGFNWETIIAPGAFAVGLATGRTAFQAGGQALNAPVIRRPPYGNFPRHRREHDNQSPAISLTRASPLTQGAAIPGSLFGQSSDRPRLGQQPD